MYLNSSPNERSSKASSEALPNKHKPKLEQIAHVRTHSVDIASAHRVASSNADNGRLVGKQSFSFSSSEA